MTGMIILIVTCSQRGKKIGEIDFWQFHQRESFEMHVRHEPLTVSSAVIVIFFYLKQAGLHFLRSKCVILPSPSYFLNYPAFLRVLFISFSLGGYDDVSDRSL